MENDHTKLQAKCIRHTTTQAEENKPIVTKTAASNSIGGDQGTKRRKTLC
jgi:hypothetical protein